MWEIRMHPFEDGDVVVEFWHKGSLKFMIAGQKDGTGKVLTNAGHYRATLIPNFMNGLHVETKKPNPAADGK